MVRSPPWAAIGPGVAHGASNELLGRPRLDHASCRIADSTKVGSEEPDAAASGTGIRAGPSGIALNELTDAGIGEGTRGPLGSRVAGTKEPDDSGLLVGGKSAAER